MSGARMAAANKARPAMAAEHWDAFLDYQRLTTPRGSLRKSDPLPATLGAARRHHLYLVAWCRVCRVLKCLPLAP